MVNDGATLLAAYKEDVLTKDEFRMALGYKIEGNAALKDEIRQLKADLKKEQIRANEEYLRGYNLGFLSGKAAAGASVYTTPTVHPYPYKPTWVSTPNTWTVNTSGAGAQRH